MTWTYDANLERARQALASPNELVRRLQRQALDAPTSASRELAAQLDEYEQDLTAHIAAGRDVPDGVLPPAASTEPREGLAADIVKMLSRPRPPEPQPSWRPDPRIEQLRRYQSSTDERERAIAGQSAALVRSYEADLRRHLAEGGQLPRGVLELPRDVTAGGHSWQADWTRPVA